MLSLHISKNRNEEIVLKIKHSFQEGVTDYIDLINLNIQLISPCLLFLVANPRASFQNAFGQFWIVHDNKELLDFGFNRLFVVWSLFYYLPVCQIYFVDENPWINFCSFGSLIVYLWLPANNLAFLFKNRVLEMIMMSRRIYTAACDWLLETLHAWKSSSSLKVNLLRTPSLSMLPSNSSNPLIDFCLRFIAFWMSCFDRFLSHCESSEKLKGWSSHLKCFEQRL